MEAQLSPAASYPAQLYSQSFTREVPTDSRFLQCSYVKYPSSSALDSGTITFDLNKFESANVYQIQNACLEVRYLTN